MNPSTDHSQTQIQIQCNPPDHDNHHLQIQHEVLPLLLQPSYARSKSLLFDDLRNFRISLKWCALDHSSCVGKLVSYFVFFFLTIVVPIVSCLSVKTLSTDDYSFSFNLLAQFPESGLAAVAFLSLLRFFKRYGLRQLLFLDGLQEDSVLVRRGYTRELDRAFRYLACILLPSFFVELAHKIIFFSSVKISLPYVNISSGVPLNSIMFVLVLVSWVYRTGVFLLVCVLFRLTCELQILRFGGLHNMFEGPGSDVGVIFREHIRIKKQLSATSHRYRFFIITCSVVITVSQFAALLLVLTPKSDNNFLNSGDLVVCSAVQLSGLFLCLLGAARITHRAQGIVSVATRWHMSVTCGSTDRSDLPKLHVPRDSDGSGSDSDSSNIFPACTASAQNSAVFQTRQALVDYLRHNNGGITLYGYALDRGLLHTLFAFEFSLVMWILSKVVVLS